jgi:hypothetical protein
MTTSTGTAAFTSWDETPAFDASPPVPRLASAVVRFEYQGALVATSTCRYVLRYDEAMAGTFVGLEEVTGTLEGRAGSFVLRHEGTFGADGVAASWTVVPGSGTDGLADLSGSGGFQAPHGSDRWDYRLGHAG